LGTTVFPEINMLAFTLFVLMERGVCEFGFIRCDRETASGRQIVALYSARRSRPMIGRRASSVRPDRLG
jgi:hypothetical protein